MLKCCNTFTLILWSSRVKKQCSKLYSVCLLNDCQQLKHNTSALQELVQLQHLGAAVGPKTAEAGAGASICG